MVAGPLEEGSQGGLFLLIKPLADGRVAGPQDPVEVRCEQGRSLGVGLVKLDQAAVDRRGLQNRRLLVGDGLVGLRLPCQKLFNRAKGGRVDIEFKRILRGHETPLTGGGKLKGIAGHDVPDRGPVGIRHRALGNNRVPLSDRQRLKGLSCGTTGFAHGHSETRADLSHNRGQVPLGQFREILAVGPASRPFAIPPLVLLVIAPGPVGSDRLEHGLCLGRGLCHFSREPDHPLGVVARPVARLGEHPRGDRPGCLGPGPVGDRGPLNAGDRLQGRLRLPLVERRLDLLPGIRPRPHRHLLRPCPVPHPRASEENHPGSEACRHYPCGPAATNQ